PSGPAPSLANIETKNHSEIMQAYKDIVKSLQESQQKHNDLLQRHSDLTKHHVELMRAHQELLESLKKGGAGGGGGGAAAGQPKKNRAKHPALGVVRLDYDYPPAPGDSDHPGSFGYEVYYRCCPGLTFEMCQEGHFPEAVERRFADAIKHLEAASWGSEEAKVWKSRHPPLQVGEAFVKASGHDAANGVQASEKTGVRLEQTWSHCDLFLMTVVAEL
ncbi:ALMA3, partial [Symbiodinium necroappetens]